MTQGPPPSAPRRQPATIGKRLFAATLVVALLGIWWWVVCAYLIQPSTVIAPSVSSQQGIQAPPSLLNFTGTVVDAITHQPVKEFTATVGYKPPNQVSIRYDLDTRARRQMSPGKYSLHPIPDLLLNVQWFVRIDARGYLPSVSAAQTDSATVNFELTPGKDLVGRVYGVDGNPAANVSLAAGILGSTNVSIEADGTLSILEGLPSLSDADGNYDLPQEDQPFDIVASSPDGFAEVTQDDLAKSPDIHLLRLGAVEGLVLVGGKPEAGSHIEVMQGSEPITRPDLSAFSAQSHAIADSNGHFLVTHVRPGQVYVSRLIEARDGQQFRQTNPGFMTLTTAVTVEPGKTSTVNLGEGCRQVMGKVILPDTIAGPEFMIAKATRIVPVIEPMPDNVKHGTPEDQSMWMWQFSWTPAGHAYFQAHPQAAPSFPSAYWLEFAPDNTFHIEGVQPGQYHIQVTFRTPRGGLGVRLARGEANFNMTPITPDVADQPLEIPDIKVTAVDH